ncbi:MAG: phenylacetate--CoA ligase [Planctomycetaceae bacterium]|jgi:phenylacetate-CoA ligase|nr:phenylacetate--CoA ligase [Planctomycetaceae bacterium]
MTNPITDHLQIDMSQATLNSVTNLDFLTKDRLRELQWQKFEIILRHTYENSPWYHEQMVQRKLVPSDIKSFDDMYKLPFITKQILRDTYPFGLFALPMDKIVRMHASSGTTGKPIVVAHTREDLAVWAQSVVRSLRSYGVGPGDILQNAYGYGLFTGGLGLHDGGQALGVTVVPISGGNTERQVMLMRDFGATVVSCTPSYFLHIIDKAQTMGVDLRTLPIRVGAFGAEPWSDEMRKRIEADAGIKAYDIYGLTEICGPGVGAECVHQNGTHLFEDHFYPEIINPETLEPLPDGQMGELVFTTLDRFAMPMIRYRTRDLTCLISEPCPCGRTIRRMQRIAARSDDMVIIRGVNVFPSQIEAALLQVEGTAPHYQIILTREFGGLDEIEVKLEVQPEDFSDKVREIEAFQNRVRHEIHRVTGIHAKVSLVQPGSIPRSEGKAKRVIDKRII